MALKKNPLNLNPLQLRTLALLQELARHPDLGTQDIATGDVLLTQLPHPHGDHFHVGSKVVASKDATGLANPAVWTALERKGLAHGAFPYAITVTKEGIAYDTSSAGHFMHGGDH
jgi:hypothetical protein